LKQCGEARATEAAIARREPKDVGAIGQILSVRGAKRRSNPDAFRWIATSDFVGLAMTKVIHLLLGGDALASRAPDWNSEQFTK
jgi:hypothetical protein